MKPVPILAVVPLLFLLGSCAVGSWTRPNMTRAEFYEDKNHCEEQAASKYPVVMASTNFDANAIPRSEAVDACLRAKGYVFRIGG